MKKRWILLNTMFVVIIFMTLSLLLKPAQRTEQNTSISTRSQLVRSSLEKPLPGKNSDLKGFSTMAEKRVTTCSDLLEHVRSTPLSQVIEELLKHPKLLMENCPEGKSYVALREQLVNCSQTSEKHQPHPVCVQGLLKLKATLALEGVRIHDMSSMTFDQLIARFFDLMTTPPTDTQTLTQVLHELDDRDSNNPSIKKALALAYALEVSNSKNEKQQEMLEYFNHYVTEASQLNADDWQVYELKLFALAQSNPAEAKKLAAKLRQQYPHSGLGSYYLGWLSWKDDERETARTFVQEAKLRQPQDLRFEKTLNKLDSAELGAAIFEIQIGFNPTDI